MAEVDESLGQVAGVDALATDVRFAAVGEVGDAQRAVWIERRRHSWVSLPSGISIPSAPSEYEEGKQSGQGHNQYRLITDVGVDRATFA